jgi:hypothetical protein
VHQTRPNTDQLPNSETAAFTQPGKLNDLPRLLVIILYQSLATILDQAYVPEKLSR